MKIGAIPDISTLEYVSAINKRVNYKEKIKQYINNSLPENEMMIDWSKASRDYDLIPWADNLSYRQLWDERHFSNTYYNGKSIDGNCLALEFIVEYERELEIDITKWGRIQYDWFCLEFGEENVLSAMLHLDTEENPHCHFLIYHTNEAGVLTSEPYLIQNQLNMDFISRYEKDMQKYGFDEKTRQEQAKKMRTDKVSNENFYLAKIDRYISENPRTNLDDVEYVYDSISQLSSVASIIPFEKQEKILDDLLEYFTSVERNSMKQAQTGTMSKDDFFKMVKNRLKKIGIEKSDEVDIMIRRMDNAVYGNYVLEELINDPSISDIKVLSFNKIRVKQYGRRLTSNLHFRSPKDYYRFLEGFAIRNHTDLSPENAVQNFTDKTSNEDFILRVDICTNFVNSVPNPYLIIRKTAKKKYELEDLINYGMLDVKTASYLVDKAKNGKGILFTGKGASGKTSLLNTLLEFIPYNNSGLVIQENEELFTVKHPDLMFQHTVLNKRKMGIEFDLKDLARNGLLADLDYFIIGEIKGAEAHYFLNASYTGHKCWATCHGSSATEAMNKLADYVTYESSYSQSEAKRMLTAMEVVVFMKNFKVAEIAEVVGFDEQKKDLQYRLIYKAAC